MRNYTTRIIFILFLWIAAFFILSVKAFSQTLAFPSAEGFGRFATGGRGGEVVHVTNLNDAGTGSLRDAISKPNRIVVFDVGGIINITSRLVVQKNIYIAGQTAPGEGITIYGNGVALNSSSGNSIIRYIRIRMGENGDYRKDALGISDGQNYIFDHVSISWGWDGTVDVNGSNIDNITFQDCIIGQGIDIVGHSTGGLMQSGKWSVIRSLYIDNETRNPKGKGTHEVMNCVMYNWGSNGYIMGSSEGVSEVNAVGNTFIYGPSSSSNSHITGTTPTFRVYGADNWVDANKNGVFDPSLLTDYKTATKVNTPYNYDGMKKVMPAKEALDYVLVNAGASRPHDAVDKFLMNEIRSYGTKGQIIKRESDNGIPGNVGTIANGTPPLDTDRDGMPDEWEQRRGLNPNVADDKEDDDNDGYTNIEEYLSCLVGESDDCNIGSIIDCNGVENGQAYLDDCQTCVGGTTGKKACYIDCNGVKDGKALIDDCGTCAGGNTGVVACTGALEGEDFCDAVGIFEDKNLGFHGEGYLNLDNAIGSNATWYLISDLAHTATLGVRYANGSTAARGVAVTINGTQQTTLGGTATGAWTTWVTTNISVNLVKGVNKLVLTSTTADGAPNIDHIIFTNTSLHASGCSADCNGTIGGDAYKDDCDECVGGTTGKSACIKDCNGDINGTAYLDECDVCVGGNSLFKPCVASLEAEEACTVDGIALESTNQGFSGAGYVNTDNALGSSISWVLNSSTEQTATLTFRYANGGESSRDGEVYINGTLVGSLVLPTTEEWHAWSIKTLAVNLVQGTNELVIKATTSDGLANIDMLSFSAGVSTANCIVTSVNESLIHKFGVYPNPTTSKINLNATYTWDLFNAQGLLLESGNGNELDLQEFTSGTYFIKINGEVISVIKE